MKLIRFFALVIAGVAALGSPSWADDLAASVLPLSRSATIGQTVTAFATVINSSGGALSSCTVALPNFPGTFSFQTTNPSTNAVTGTLNGAFSLANGASQSLVLALQPQSAIAPTEEEFVFQCSGANPAVSIIGVDTLLLSASATQPPDVVALAATVSNDGVLRFPGTGQAQAFSVASVNLGAQSTITVSVDWGDITLPIALSLCETNPSTGSCINSPSNTVALTIPPNGTPTFAFFATANGPLPFFPALVRAFVRFTDTTGATRGSTSIALTTNPTLGTGQTAGGYYQGVYRVTSGPSIGYSAPTDFLISEDGELRGVTLATSTGPINALFSASALLNNQLLYVAMGEVLAANGNVLVTGALASPLDVAGAVSPHNFLAGLYAITGGTGSFYAQYDAAIYEQPSSLALVEGTWTIRTTAGAAIGALQVAANGAFNGSASDGCGFNGTISLINTNYNAYRVNLNVANCGADSGAYEGLAHLITTFSPNDTFQFLLSNSNFAELNAITRF
jgi:hypothetical protein